MFTLMVIGALFLGGAALVRFWDDIKNWLNNVAADAVERTFGYSARQNIQKAVAVVDLLISKIRNKSIVYSKKSSTDTYFDKTTITAETGIENVEEDVMRELRNNGNRLTQTYEYTR